MTTEATKIAIPLKNDRVSGHFGHPECFSFVSVDSSAQKILSEERLTPPPHEPGRLPLWLAEHGVHVVLAGGVGHRAVTLLNNCGIEVQTGVPSLTAFEVVHRWLDGDLKTADNTCSHGGEADHKCRHHAR
jgi:predicted Fe-Mo cluster-binding NifX family protein